MSKITNAVLTRSGTGCFIAVPTTAVGVKVGTAADESPFRKVVCCNHPVLDELLPPRSAVQHDLRKRRHDRTLHEKKGHLSAEKLYCC